MLGLDELNFRSLQELPNLSHYKFHPVLEIDEVVNPESIDFNALLDRAQRELEAFDGRIDAIIGYWDFPVSCLVPILCQRFGLPSVPLEAVVKCEHKYWSRLQQQESIEEYPRFGLVDLAVTPELPDEVGLPMWVKPVKSFSSDLAFQIKDRDDFDHALGYIKEGIGKVGKPFDALLNYLDLPENIEATGGQACLAEEAVAGRQVTVEGFSLEGRVQVQGVIDSINYEGTSSFLRYQYPSQLPDSVQDRLITTTVTLIKHLRLEPSTFNVEYFWNPDTDAINVIEVNPRLSQSHARLFDSVDGAPNHQCMVHLALGENPELPYRQGDFAIAGKWFLRRFTDGVVRRIPTQDEIARLEADIPGITIDLIPAEGDRLSELPGQDSYSYELADIFIGARDADDLADRYHRCVDSLRFEFDP